MILRFVTIILPAFIFFCMNTANAVPFITQLGESTVVNSNQGNDSCVSVAVDINRNIYCAGSTTRSGEPNGGGLDAYILKLNPNGNIVWLTHLGAETLAAPGGSNSTDDACLDITVDDLGNVYCAGYTLSSMSEPNAGDYDVFIMKLNANGGVVWHTQFGQTTKAVNDPLANTAEDKCLSIAVDKQYNVYCAGYTKGFMSEPNSVLYVDSPKNNDAIVIKLNSDGQLQWLKQFGLYTKTPTGSNFYSDACNAVAIDDFNNVYCAGYTSSDMSEPNSGSHLVNPGSLSRTQDGFVMKLNSDGDLLWHTQFGANTGLFPGDLKDRADLCSDVKIGSNGLVYCSVPRVVGVGSYAVRLYPNTGRVIDSINIGDGFFCDRMDVDMSGNIYCTEDARLGDFSIKKLNSAGNILWQWGMGATYQSSNSVIGDSYENCNDIAVDDIGNVYCGGYTNGDAGEINGNRGIVNLGYDIVVVGLLPDGRDAVLLPPANNPPIAEAGSAQSVNLYSTVTLDGTGSSDPDGNVPLTYQWAIASQPSGSNIALSGQFSSAPTFTPMVEGQYTFQLIVGDSLGLSGIPDSVTVNASVIKNTSIIENDGDNATALSKWILIYFSPDFLIPGPGQSWVLTADAQSSGGNAHVINASADSGRASFAWRFIPDATDYYSIDAIWPAYGTNSSTITYTIRHASGESFSSPQNQQLNGGQWNALGSYFFQQGISYEVILTGRPDGDVIADAIRVSNI